MKVNDVENGKVSHSTHKNNLIPKIEEFKTAIEILKNSES